MKHRQILFICLIGLFVRLVVIYIGVWIDDHSVTVKYTDIDYKIFSDAAILVANGKSPYDRVTYRYPPILAWLITPIQYFPNYGKVLFSIADILCIFEVYSITLHIYSVVPAIFLAWAWAFNPMNINMCTRGSMDAIANWLGLLLLSMILRRRYKASGFLFGCIVHLRLFPIIYAPTFAVFIWFDKLSPYRFEKVKSLVTFFGHAFCSFAVLSLIAWCWYGSEYLENSIWYHLVRQDHRHNFSFHFYGTYLKLSKSLSSSVVEAKSASFINTAATKLIFFLPQFCVIGGIAWLFGKQNLPAALFLQTMTFVTFNKVITAQYFSWYLPYFYAVSPEIVMMCTKRVNGKQFSLWNSPGVALVALLILWLVSLSAWLFEAYRLEFESLNTFREIWLMSIVFFIVNCSLIGFFVVNLHC